MADIQFVDRLSVDRVARLFPAKAHRNVAENWPLIQTALKARGLGNNEELVLYVLATIRVETGTFSPAAESQSRHSELKIPAHNGYLGIHHEATTRPFGHYDRFRGVAFDKQHRMKVRVGPDTGNCFYRGEDENLMRSLHGDPLIPECNDGELYRGRGFIQITGRYNYTQMQIAVGDALGIDLVGDPDSASNPRTAAGILAAFIAKRQDAILQAMQQGDYLKARKQVNKQGLGITEFEAFIRKYRAQRPLPDRPHRSADSAQQTPPPSPGPSPTASPSSSPEPTIAPTLRLM